MCASVCWCAKIDLFHLIVIGSFTGNNHAPEMIFLDVVSRTSDLEEIQSPP